MEGFAQGIQEYFPGFAVPEEVPYPVVNCVVQAPVYCPYELAKADVWAFSVGRPDACAEVETNVPSDSDGIIEDEEGNSAANLSALDQMPRWVHCPGATEPRWVPLPSGLDPRLLPASPAWGPAEPAVLRDFPAPYSSFARGSLKALQAARQRPPASLARRDRAAVPPPPPPSKPPSIATSEPSGADPEEPTRAIPKSGLLVVAGTERTRVSWTVDAKKLHSKDQIIVSPRFDVSVEQRSVPFKMMLCPKTVSDRRGGHCFKKAKGVGFVQLKCEAASGGGTACGRLTFKVSVGREPSRGPVVHDFAQEGVAGLLEEPRHWDLAKAVDRVQQTLTVELEVLHIDNP